MVITITDIDSNYHWYSIDYNSQSIIIKLVIINNYHYCNYYY